MPENYDSISKAHLTAGRAVDQLRRQLGIVFEENNGAVLGAYPIEGVTPRLLTDLRAKPKQRMQLLLTGARARHIGLAAIGTNVVCLDAENLALAEMQALADPLIQPTQLPEVSIVGTTPAHDTLMTLVKYASLLPAVLVIETNNLPQDWLRVSAADVAAYWANPPLDMVPLVETALPIKAAEQAKIVCFRQRYGTSAHLALIFGDPTAESPLARVHSSCITGDILGSLRCDCGDQLQLALEQIAKEGNGVLIYLHQEGRGIGIINKLRAYALQERGVDTYEANLMLGFEEDERDFALAAAILKKLGIKRCRLLTNNPKKLENLQRHGIEIIKQVAIAVTPGQHNHTYLRTKALKSGHLF